MLPKKLFVVSCLLLVIPPFAGCGGDDVAPPLDAGYESRTVNLQENQPKDSETSADYFDYHDPEFGFLLKYPAVLTASQSRRGVYFSDSANQKIIEVIVLTNPEREPLLNFLTARYGYESGDLMPVSVTGLLGYKFQNATGAVIYLGSGNQVFALTWYDSIAAVREANRRSYLRVVQSFSVSEEVQSETDETANSATTADKVAENKALPAISATELTRGWYYGDTSGKKSGTPATWILVDSGTRFAMWKRPENVAGELSVLLPNPTATVSALPFEQQSVLAYLKINLLKLAPEPPTNSVSAGWVLQQVSFVAPNYAYATYASGTESRRLLLTYTLTGSQVSIVKQAYFLPGSDRDWIVSEGIDAAFGKALTIVSAESGEVAAEVKSGYRLYANTRFGYSLQYPKNWYWQNASTTRTEFSDAPFPAGLVRITVEVAPGTNYKFGTLTASGSESVIYAKLSSDQSLKISGSSDRAETLKVMAETTKSQ